MQNFVRFDQILGPLWSLPYEVQIYCFFPIIYLGLRRFRSTKVIIFAWTILAAMDQILAPRIAKYGYIGRFVTIPDLLFYFLLFLAGVFAYKEMQTSRRVLPFWFLPALLGFTCIVWLLSYDNVKCIFISLSLGLALPYIQSCEIGTLNNFCSWIAKYSYWDLSATRPCHMVSLRPTRPSSNRTADRNFYARNLWGQRTVLPRT